MTRTHKQIAEAWVNGLMAGDFDSLRAIMSPDMRVWHSHDNKWISREEVEARRTGAERASPAFAEPRVTMTDTGALVQTAVVLPGVVEAHIVQVLTIGEGGVTAVEEYIAPEMPLG